MVHVGWEGYSAKDDEKKISLIGRRAKKRRSKHPAIDEGYFGKWISPSMGLRKSTQNGGGQSAGQYLLENWLPKRKVPYPGTATTMRGEMVRGALRVAVIMLLGSAQGGTGV